MKPSPFFLFACVHVLMDPYVRSTSWKFSFQIVYVFKKTWNFLTKSWYFD